MKNFRKVLALVLVVATLFSFAAMAGAKSLSDYEDADKVNYDVAVDVLSTLGVLNGYEDDTFKPTNTISREEMAKMIAVLANTGDDISKLYASANAFADVESDRWSASYIAYCAQTGIVAGRTADTFDPYGKVTGLETAKMLLVVMGFSATEQGYVGANWKINVLRDAKNCGLLNGFAAGYDVEAAITREEAANMMLNALQGNVIVGVLSENILKVTNTLYTKWEGTLLDATNLNKAGFAKLYGNVIVAQNTLLEALYGGMLKEVESADCYGRPGMYWSFIDAKGKELADKVFFGPAAVLSETKAVDLDKALKDEIANGYALEVYVDGKCVNNRVMPKNYSFNNLERDYLGNGVAVEVYVEDTGDFNKDGVYVANGKVTIVIINTFIGKVDYTTIKKNTFTITDSKDNTYTFSNKDYGFKKNDVVLFWICNGGKESAANKYVPALHAAELATPVTATVTRVTTANDTTKVEDTVTADGKVYTYHKGTASMTTADNAYKGTHDLYLDKYGYVILWDETDVEDEVFYGYAVEKTGLKTQDTVSANGTHYWASITKDIVDFDAKLTEDVQISDWLFNKIAGNGVLFRYTVDEDGIARAYEPAESYNPGEAFATKETRNFILTKDGDLTLEDGTMYGHGTDETKYLVRTWDYENAEYIYKSFVGELDQAYAGWVNGKNGAKVATVQYFLDEKTFLEYVFVDAIYTTDATYAFILGDYESVNDDKWSAQIGSYDSYRAVIDGQEGIVLLNRVADLNENVLVKTKFSCIGLTDAGLPIYAQVDQDLECYNGAAAEYYEGKLLVGNDPIQAVYSIAADAKAVVIFGEDFDADEDGIKELEFAAIDDFKNINDYLEDDASIDGQGTANNWIAQKLWVVETSAGSGVAQTLYVIVK